jgi:hypothetical protein
LDPDSIPAISIGLSLKERYKLGDGQKYIPGLLYTWVDKITSDDELLEVPGVADMMALIILEVLTTCPSNYSSVVSSKELQRGIDMASTRLSRQKEFSKNEIRPRFPFYTGRLKTNWSTDRLFVDVGCDSLYPVEKKINRADLLAAKEQSLRTKLSKQQMAAELEEYKLEIDSKIARSENQALLPFLEHKNGVDLTISTRSNLTFERVSWYLSYAIFFITYQELILEWKIHTSFDMVECAMECIGYAYGYGSQRVKPLRKKFDVIVSFPPNLKTIFHNGGPLDMTTISLHKLEYIKGVLKINNTPCPTNSRVYRDSELSWIWNQMPDGVTHPWEATRDWFSDNGLMSIVRLMNELKSKTITPKMLSLLYEPVAPFGMATSDPNFVELKTATPKERRDIMADSGIEGQECNSQLDSVITSLADMIVDGKVDHIRIPVAEVLDKMTTSRSSGGYNVTFDWDAGTARYLGHRGRSEGTQRSVSESYTSKAISNLVLLSSMITLTELWRSGTKDIPFKIFHRIVVGRVIRNIYAVPTANQIPMQLIYDGITKLFRHGWSSQMDNFSLPNSGPMRPDSSDFVKGASCYLASSFSIATGTTLQASLDYTEMDKQCWYMMRQMVSGFMHESRFRQAGMKVPTSPRS